MGVSKSLPLTKEHNEVKGAWHMDVPIEPTGIQQIRVAFN